MGRRDLGACRRVWMRQTESGFFCRRDWMGVTRFGCLPPPGPRLDGEQTKSGFLPANLDSAKRVWIRRRNFGFCV
jgi:hypothetical protein